MIYALLYYHKKPYRDRVSFVLKQMFYHARNLGSYVFIYKTVCWICRELFGIRNGVESWIAGMIGGSAAFGESSGVSGAVNYQIVLYLFARGLEAVLNLAAEKQILPKTMDIRTPTGFRLFAGFSLALILYMTEYWPTMLKPGFVGTMDFLYTESNGGSLLGSSKRFTLIVFLISASLLIGDALGVNELKLSTMTKQMEGAVQWIGNLLLGAAK